MNKTVTPEKVRELIDIAVGAFTVHDDSISNMDNAVMHVMGWLEQNPIEPVVVGLSAEHIDCLVDFIETGEFDPDASISLKIIIAEWLKTQKFAHDEQYHVSWGEVSGNADFVVHKMEVYDTEGNVLQCVNLNTQYQPKPTQHVEVGQVWKDPDPKHEQYVTIIALGKRESGDTVCYQYNESQTIEIRRLGDHSDFLAKFERVSE
jgi:hypothetical protein